MTQLGGTLLPRGGARFLVWAPAAQRVELELDGRRIPMHGLERGYHGVSVAEARDGARYQYILHQPENESLVRPDPASRLQPQGPHGASELVASVFSWTDQAWRGVPMSRLVIYELHVGTFTPGGTFDSAIEHLDYLRELGITAIELMPIAQFPGARNWGYDGVGMFAAQNTYGGPRALKRLVNACHERGLAVVLDVVYNHLGPEGNYLSEFGPYFTDRYQTPWGRALNFAGPQSDEVRRFFIESALYWISECHIDAVRLDAVHAIVDPSPLPFVQELAAAVHQRAVDLGRHVHVIAESAANDARVISSPERGGSGCDAQWNDDFHHALRSILTNDLSGYYASFGEIEHLARAFRHGFAYTGEWSAYHQRRHGSPTPGMPGSRFIVFAQNHDQVGNRMKGERLGALVSLDQLKLAAAAVILSPFVPLLFMGEEYGERVPFLYFISHTDPDLVDAVRRGRKEEFADFKWEGEPPDPQAEETFRACTLDHTLRQGGEHAALLAYYRELFRLRREVAALATHDKETQEVIADEATSSLLVRRWSTGSAVEPVVEVLLLFNFGETETRFAVRPGAWRKVVDSGEARFGGSAAADQEMKVSGPSSTLRPPRSFALFIRESGRRSDLEGF